MRKSILLIILLVGILLPINTYAEDNYEYNSIHLSAVFVTSANVDSISKIKVNYRTFYNGVTREETVYLLRENNFSMTINLGTINDALYIYGYCITKDDLADKAGFLPITAEKRYNDDKKSIDIVLSVDFNSMKFDGKKYRANSELTPNEIAARKNGEITSIEDITGTSDTSSTTITTTTQPIETTTTDSVVIGNTTIPTETTTIILQDDGVSRNNDKKSNKKENNTSIKLFIIIGVIIGGIVTIFLVITMIKIAQANKRV